MAQNLKRINDHHRRALGQSIAVGYHHSQNTGNKTKHGTHLSPSFWKDLQANRSSVRSYIKSGSSSAKNAWIEDHATSTDCKTCLHQGVGLLVQNLKRIHDHHRRALRSSIAVGHHHSQNTSNKANHGTHLSPSFWTDLQRNRSSVGSYIKNESPSAQTAWIEDHKLDNINRP